MDVAALIAASAANQIAWQEASLRHLGRPVVDDGIVWTCPHEQPDIWHTAIVRTTDNASAVSSLLDHAARSTYVSVCDTWRALALEPLGLVARAIGHWYHRPIAAWSRPEVPAGIAIEAVRDAERLAQLERATCIAFDAPIVPDAGSIHPPGLLEDRDAVLLVATDGDVVVGTALGHVAAGVLGIYGVGTVPSHRRLGIAAALTAGVGAARPELDAVLQPSPAAATVYRRLGFERVGSFTHWQRPR